MQRSDQLIAQQAGHTAFRQVHNVRSASLIHRLLRNVLISPKITPQQLLWQFGFALIFQHLTVILTADDRQHFTTTVSAD